MPSSYTRTKLKKFQFIEGVPAVEVEDDRGGGKENSTTARGIESTTGKATPTVKAVETPAIAPKPATSRTCPPPSTPAMKRLPLADLVGNIDDSSRHAPEPIVSPEEQLIWRGSQPTHTPLLRKHHKRARSSSPAAPSQEDHTAKRELTTPQADPALELWSRYTSNKGTPSANKSVAFAHLINESSPRSTAAAGSVSGLRRWASCGHEFPASTRKRRRTHGVFQGEGELAEDVFVAAPSSEGAVLGPPKSKVASMVQRMKDCVTRSQPRISSQLPSSSSPLPDTGERHGELSGSPLQRRAQEPHVGTSGTLQGEEEVIHDEVQAEENAAHIASGSSDEFGDDDFDAEMVEALDITPQMAEPPAQFVQATSYVTIPTEPLQPPPPQTRSPAEVAQRRDDDSDDEFGMSDDGDEFAADMEQVASLYDNRSVAFPAQPPSRPAAQASKPVVASNTLPTAVINLVDDDDYDEFGDDIDEDVFAAAEVAATQTSANHVRRTYTYP
jgi:DNA replication ATP-dependent helicase Dna2